MRTQTGKAMMVFVMLSWSSAMAQTISNIVVANISHASVHASFTVTPAAFVQIKYGTASGQYQYSSASYRTSDAEFSIGGLQPGATYYFRMTARPDQDDDNNICQTDACGSVEQVITTLAEPSPHPAPPQPPLAWSPAHPDTSAYTVIPMQVAASNGECVAAQPLAQQSGWKAAVNQGDNIPALFGKIGYGTVLEFPQGTTCKVYQTDSYWHTGYVLPALPLDANAGGNVDSPNHRWIVFRTKQINAADFPPFGVRTGPQWASKMAKFVVQTPGMQTSQQNFTGQIFDCYNQHCHHFWFENMEWTHLADSSVYPPGTIDPLMFTTFLRVDPYGGQNPAYIVIDRVYAHTQPWPARQWNAFYLGGDHSALLSSYVDLNYWRLGLYPTSGRPTLTNGNTVLNMPAQKWAFNAHDNPMGMSTAATATLSAPSTFAGSFVGYLGTGTNGLTIQYSQAAGVNINCSNCTATAVASPAVPSTQLTYFTGQIANGQFQLTSTALDSSSGGDSTTRYAEWKPLGLFVAGGNVGIVDNTFFTAVGQTIYNDPDGPRLDRTFTHNYLYFPRSKMQGSPQWDGYTYTFRNPFETKQALRWRIEGNIFDGSAAFQNAGYAIMVVGSFGGTGTQDVLIKNNILKHLASGFQCSGGGAQMPPDAPTTERVEVANNLWIDLNRDIYSFGGAGLHSGPFMIAPGCEDVNIHNNTVGLTLGPGPAILVVGAASSGATVLGEGLSVKSNVINLSLNALDAMWSQCGQLIASHPAVPAPICSVPGTTPYTSMLNAAILRAGNSVVPNYVFTHNVLIGAETKYGVPNWTDLDQSTINTIAAKFPPGNFWPTGSTYAKRLTAANWDPVNFTIQPSKWNAGDMGARVDDIRAAAGIVQRIAVRPSANGFQFSYEAPDSRTCSVDVSADGVSWTRTADAGGARVRTLAVAGLSLNTSYQYRLMCYFDQSAAFEFPADQITSGTKSTTAAVARNASVGFSLSGTSRAVKERVTFTPLGGGAATDQICTVSPCSIAITAGSYDRALQPLDSNGIALGPADHTILVVR